MSLLLDTHVVLWWLSDDATLSDAFKTRLDDEPDIWVSAVSVWEVTVKESLGKLESRADLPEAITGSGFRPLAIAFGHAAAAGRLPPLHRDPFDRMLIAQARCEGLTLATRDPQIHRYDVDLLRV